MNYISVNFRFSPDVLTRLGEELTPYPEQGIIELVKNSYDADATHCVVKLIENQTGVTKIIVEDNGIGMDEEKLKSGWFLIGRSLKSNDRDPSEKYQRLPVGAKGLGRLAALRQGNIVRMVTRPESEPGKEYRVEINWDKYKGVETVEEIFFDIIENPTNKPCGTELEIYELRTNFSKREIQRLARQLLLLSDPFESTNGFKVELQTSSYKDIERILRGAYLESAEYRLHARVNALGLAEASVLDWKGDLMFRAKPEELSPTPYKTVNATFDLYGFILNQETFSSRTYSLKEVKTWLSLAGGVHVYHRGVKVRPYGDPENDWLDMNLARVRHPEERPSTNNSIGRIILDDVKEVFVQKTDRVGFIENEAFSELKRFATDALNWMAKVRLREAEKRRAKNRQETERTVNEAKKRFIESVKTSVSPEALPKVKEALDKFDKSLDKQMTSLREDLQFYRSLATAGAIAARFAHQTGQPISLIKRAANEIEDTGLELLGEKYAETLGESVEILRKTSDVIIRQSELPKKMLARDKRRIEVVPVHKTLDETIEMLGPFLEDAKIKVEVEKFVGEPRLKGTRALLEVIVANFITNSITALTEVKGAPRTGRKIKITTNILGGRIIISAADNGLGIQMDLDEIWLPGHTTTAGGTGFGLTIVRDSVSDLGGTIRAIPKGMLGGAEFIVDLPLVEN